jgi:hypothetical protein
MLAVVLMILGVFALLSGAILLLRAYSADAPGERLLLLAGAAVVVPGALFGTASLLERLAGSAARREAEGEPLLPVRWGAEERFGADDQGNGFCPDEPGVRQ